MNKYLVDIADINEFYFDNYFEENRRGQKEKAPALQVCDSKEIEKARLMVSSQRPNWGVKQVRSVEDIVLGNFYLSTNTVYGQKLIYRILSIDVEKGFCATEWHTFTDRQHPLVYDWNLPLCDYSILPYETGAWNLVNYLEHMEDVSTPEEALDVLEKCGSISTGSAMRKVC